MWCLHVSGSDENIGNGKITGIVLWLFLISEYRHNPIMNEHGERERSAQSREVKAEF